MRAARAVTTNHLMTRAIRIHAPGGPEAMVFEEVALPKPGPGEVLLEHGAIGINYIDVYHRSGLYKLPEYPSMLGIEGAGIVRAVGPGAELFKPGDRAVYAGGPLGAYSEQRIISERHLFKLPDDISDELAASVMVKGLTAHFLVRRTFLLQSQHTILVHAAAGGVGQMLCQWAQHIGARVIGTVGSKEKAQIAKDNGCEFPIVYTEENVVERVKEITKGHGVNIVYDSVGQATFMDSLDCLQNFGMLVSFGQASGKIPPFDVSLLQQKGSLFLTRPSLMHYIQNYTEYLLNTAEMLDLVQRKILRPHIGKRFALKDAGDAHRALEARQTTGSTLLLPK